MAKPRKTLLEKTTYALTAKLLYYVQFAFCNGNREEEKELSNESSCFQEVQDSKTAHLHVHVPSYIAVTSYIKQNIKLGRGR